MIKENYLFKLTKNEDNVIDFKLVEGNTYVKVFVLEEDIIRFLMYEKELKLDRTWLVAPGMDDIEKEGRNRLDISPFSKPEYILHYDDLTCTIETSKIKLVINLNGMKTTWYAKLNGSEVKFASDRKTQAYNIEGSLGKGVFHYLERSINEQYYGLGEKAGIAVISQINLAQNR
jgi:alpha-glucosidase